MRLLHERAATAASDGALPHLERVLNVRAAAAPPELAPEGIPELEQLLEVQ
jgi:hypothetical protein